MSNYTPKILLVDDQPNNLRFLSNVLLEQGYQVQRAINGQLGLNAALAFPPDLILLDIMLPDINGYEVCASLKATDKTKEIPVIFLSAINETQEKVKAFQVGGVDYITKPFQVEEVLARIQNQLTIQKLQTQIKQQNLSLQNEIKERQQAETQLQYRLLLETALEKVSRKLLTKEETSLNELLGIIGMAVGVNRAYIIQYQDNYQFSQMTDEWCDNYTQSLTELFQNRNICLSSWWVQKLNERENIVISDLDALPPAAISEKKLLQMINVSSIIAVPLYTESGQLWGEIGFTTTAVNSKNWSEEDAQLLQVVGEMLYTYCARKQAQTELRASEALYAGIFNHSAEAIFLVKLLPNDKFAFETINPTYERAIGIAAANIAGKTPSEVMLTSMATQFEQRYRDCVAAGIPITYEETLPLPGETLTWRTILVPIRDITGKIVKLQGSSRDITEQIRQQQELTRSNAELEQFAYVASHDLQAPLATIASYAQLLEQRYKAQLDNKGERFIHNIVKGTVRMQTLINDLLEYSQVGRKEQPFQEIDGNLVFKEACANLQLDIRNHQAVIKSSNLPRLIGSRSRLVQLFQNLIGNAIKYRCQQQPEVNISVTRQEDRWLFAVKDNGIGIDPKHSDRIFQIFQRLHTRYDYSGTGIGLAICKKIVESHGGRIWVESKLGQGSVFYFTLVAHKQ